MRRQLAAGILILASVVSGCTAQQWGFPRIALEARSPDGRFVAFVRNHPNLDPYDQSLWLQAEGEAAVALARVPPDAWWCDRIVWSADSRVVAFVIADAVVRVWDARSRANVFSGFVGRRSWDTPPRYVLRDLSLSQDGSRATFRECERTWHPVDAARQNRRGTRVRPTIGDCRDDSTVAFVDVPPDNLWR